MAVVKEDQATSMQMTFTKDVLGKTKKLYKTLSSVNPECTDVNMLGVSKEYAKLVVNPRSKTTRIDRATLVERA